MTPPARHINPGQDTTIDPAFHYDHLRSAPIHTTSEKRRPLLDAVLYQRLRAGVQIMAQIMERKFRKHDNWGNPFKGPYDPEFLQRRMKEEEKEFYDAIAAKQPPAVVWEEAADRINFILIETVEYEKKWREENGYKLDDWMVEP